MAKGATGKRIDRRPTGRPRAAAARGTMQQADDALTFEPRPPLKPQRKLLALLATVLALWLGFLLFLYFTTVHGRPPVQAPQPAHAPALPYSLDRARAAAM